MKPNFKKYYELELITREPLSLESTSSGEENATLKEQLADTITMPVEDRVMEKELAFEMEIALAELPEKLQKVIRLRYGLGNNPSYTLEKIGLILGISYEGVRKLEEKALTLLSQKSRVRQLASDYLGIDRAKAKRRKK